MGVMVCGHCGSDGHGDDDCGVKDATRRILANYVPRSMWTGHVCPTCRTDGVWDWGLGSTTFVCRRCGFVQPVSAPGVQ